MRSRTFFWTGPRETSSASSRHSEKAEAALLRYVEADATAADDLELWHEESTRLPVDPDKLHRATGA